jgi:hypothetical protein
MSKNYSYWLARGLGKSLMAVLVALSLVFMATLSTLAGTVNISDRAGILNANRVRNEASSLPDRLDIYTTSNFNGSRADFDQVAKRSIPNSTTIVMAISTNLSHLAIVGGSGVGLSNSRYTDATNSFISDYKSNHDYTSATIAAIDSLRNSLGGSGFGSPVSGAGSIFGSNTLCCIGLLVIAGIALFAFVRRRSGGGFFNRRNTYGPTYDQPFNQPYNQPGYPPNYGPGYPPNQGGGVNPWMAGGLGAAAGGFLGYELGKEAGERERDDDGGNFGGGASGDFGGDNGGFGGDNNNGGDFGGGASGNF